MWICQSLIVRTIEKNRGCACPLFSEQCLRQNVQLQVKHGIDIDFWTKKASKVLGQCDRQSFHLVDWVLYLKVDILTTFISKGCFNR